MDPELSRKHEELRVAHDQVVKENEELRRSYESMDKLVHDRDRQARGDRKQIEHFE